MGESEEIKNQSPAGDLDSDLNSGLDVDVDADADKDAEGNGFDEALSPSMQTVESSELEELKGYKDKYYYVAAEMDNLQKRLEREKASVLKYGTEKILSELIEVVDNLERSSSAIENEKDEKIKNLKIGVEMVKKQFLEVLSSNGLERLDAQGKIFDPNFHEAMATQEAEDKEPLEVISQYQAGYLLNGRLIRPAKVIIAKDQSN